MTATRRAPEINGDALIDAMTPMMEGEEAWLDLETGEIVEFLSEDMDDGLEEESAARARVEAAPDRFERIPRVDSRQEYALMAEFAARVDEPDIAEKLEFALRGKGAFGRFKDVVWAYPDLRREWFEYRKAAFLQIAKRWFEEIGLEPQLKFRSSDAGGSQPAPPSPKAPPIRLRDLLLLGAPDGKTELLGGRVYRMVRTQSSSEARQVFKSLAREIYESEGLAWRNRFIEGRNSIEVGDYELSVEGALITLNVKTSIETWRRFSG